MLVATSHSGWSRSTRLGIFEPVDVPASSTQALLTDLTRVLLAFTLMTIAMRYPVGHLRANARPVVCSSWLCSR